MENSKKILYITRYSIDEEFNLKKKFDGQLNAFRNLGFDVFFIGFDKNYFYLIHNDEKTVIGKTHFGFPLYLHMRFYVDLNNAASKIIESYRFDYVYWRAAPLWKSSCKVAKTIKAVEAQLIYEIPTFPQVKEEHQNMLRKVFARYSDRFTDKFNSLIDYYVLIGEDAGGEYRGKPAINIENGIDVNSIKARIPKCDKDTVHILALASMCYWHGYDRLIKSLAQYKGDQKVVIHMVGGNDGGCLLEWKQLAHDLGLDETVIFHNSMFGEELDEIVDRSDLGAASLGRKDFKFISELKTREYIARGLPFIMAVDDVILSKEEEKYWIKITNDDQIPDMSEIVHFALRMRERDNLVSDMRELASSKLSWDAQYKKMFDIIENGR